MAWTLYRSDDVGAPVLTAAAGSLIALLDAILVNGYGTKPAAGWTKAFGGTNIAAYRMATTNGGNGHYMQVIDTGVAPATTSAARLRGYEVMTDVNTGTGPFPSAAQITDGLYIHKSSTTDATARPWVAFCNDRVMYLWVRGNVTSLTSAGTSADHTTAFGQGDSFMAGDQYHTFAIGATASAITSSAVFGELSNSDTLTTGHYVARAYTQSEGSRPVAKSSPRVFTTQAVMGGSSNIVSNGADPISLGFYLYPVFLHETTTAPFCSLRLKMPRIYHPAVSLLGAPMDIVSGRGPTAGRTFLILPAYSANTAGRVWVDITGAN